MKAGKQKTTNVSTTDQPVLDKEQAKLAKFDNRGVQTLFRTLSRNHYMLLKMTDNKASIVLTINSIIISIAMGVMYIAPESERTTVEVCTRILFNSGLLSMVFALFSMLPHKYIGKAYRKSNYKGTLYAFNFSNQSLEDFRSDMHQVMSNGNTLYNEMISDLYFLGKAITYKQRLLLVSVIIFLIGLIIANGVAITQGL